MKKFILLGIIIMAMTFVNAAEWQFSVDTGVKKTGKAFLWIPPDCKYVRGLIVGQQVILEKIALEDPQIRAVATREHLAIIFIVPAAIGYDEFGPQGKGAATFQEILDKLAEVSGYSEISQAPFLAIGHSGGAIFAWRAGYWKPNRCFGIIGLHSAPIGPPAHDQKATVDGVPLLDITGQYESWGNTKLGIEHHIRWVRGDLLAFRGRWEKSLMSELVQPGAGHFNWDEDLAKYVSMFIEKAAKARIPQDPAPAGKEPVLTDIPIASGWLTDCNLMDSPRYPAAPYKEFKGDPSLAFWHLDEELALANAAYSHSQQDKKLQLITFVQQDKPLKPAWIEDLQFDPLEDGLTIKVKATFVTQAPPEFIGAENPLGHAEGPIKFRLFGGWSGGGEQVGPDTFRVKFDRFSIVKGAGGLMVMAYHPGDAKFAYTEQPCTIKFPAKNTKGQEQKITFAKIANQKLGTKEVELNATSDSGLPVRFCIIEGPVKFEGNKMVCTQIPPRTKFPVKVTVCAYQWGRSIEQFVQTAEPVIQSFFIEK